MRWLTRRTSPAMLVALVALMVALSGTAVATGLMNGDRLIKIGSLSGNRLRQHTITRRQVNLSKLGEVPRAVRADTASSASELGDVPSRDYALAGLPILAAVANGLNDEAGCASGTLAIVVRDGRGNALDGRFTFQVPGPAPAYGQIRDDGSIRLASANVTSVDHTIASGIYCIHFSTSIGQTELESSVAAIHED